MRGVLLVGAIIVLSGTSSLATPYPLPSGAVAWWKAENNTNDATGSGHTGATVGGVSYGAGEVGQAFQFNGSDGYVNVADAVDLHITGTVSIEFWASRPTPNTFDIVVEKGGDWTLGQTNYLVGLHDNSLGNALYFCFAGGCRGVVGPGDTGLHHFAVVATNGAADPTFYVDGALANTPAFSVGAAVIDLNPSTADLHIGSQIGSITYFTDPLVDELTIYNGALSAADVAGIFAAGSDGKVLVVAAPEPATLVIFGATLAGIGLLRRWR